MIVKNEEDRIGKCLSSVENAVDEIVIVDTGSTDNTKEVVEQYTKNIYDFKWIDDFAAARNYSFSKATKEYVLWLDADDILLEEDRERLIKLKSELDSSVDCVNFQYHYAFDEEGKPSLVFQRERLVKRSRKYQWVGFIHEYLDVDGKSIDADVNVTHCRVHGDGDRNLNIYRKKIEEGFQLSTRDKYYFGKELYYHELYEETIKQLEEFVELPAWEEDKLDALYRIAECYQNMGDNQKAKTVLYQCFDLAAPRAECLFRIGWIFQEEARYLQAIYWYESILKLEQPKNVKGFFFIEFWTWKPHLELCVCYYQIGNIEKAIYHNEQAAQYVPNDSAVLYNRTFFESMKK